MNKKNEKAEKKNEPNESSKVVAKKTNALKKKKKVKRNITSTPLQALVLMNDPQFFEASRIFAERIIKSKGTLEDQISHGFRLATSRHPKEEELKILIDLLRNLRKLL